MYSCILFVYMYLFIYTFCLPSHFPCHLAISVHFPCHPRARLPCHPRVSQGTFHFAWPFSLSPSNSSCRILFFLATQVIFPLTLQFPFSPFVSHGNKQPKQPYWPSRALVLLRNFMQKNAHHITGATRALWEVSGERNKTHFSSTPYCKAICAKKSFKLGREPSVLGHFGTECPGNRPILYIYSKYRLWGRPATSHHFVQSITTDKFSKFQICLWKTCLGSSSCPGSCNTQIHHVGSSTNKYLM